MTRLRLAPSSPERMAELLAELTWFTSGISKSVAIVSGRGFGKRHSMTKRWRRGARLMLRWYANGGSVLSVDWYRASWCTQYPYQLWPQDGDERLRRELDE